MIGTEKQIKYAQDIKTMLNAQLDGALEYWQGQLTKDEQELINNPDEAEAIQEDIDMYKKYIAFIKNYYDNYANNENAAEVIEYYQKTKAQVVSFGTVEAH